MDKIDRKIAAETMHSQGTLLVHVGHELHLIAHKQRAGLTDKEYRFLMARIKALKDEQEKLSKLRQRLEFNGKYR